MADIHIDDFYRDVAIIFLRLYSVFPRKTTLYVEDICGPDEPDEFGLHHPRFQACFSAMVWLAEQNYIAFEETIRSEALDQVTLTRKSFLLLSAISSSVHDEADERPPSVKEHSGTRITSLRQALHSGSSIELQHSVSELLAHPPIGDA
ncbi:MAG: hypothetical protein AAGI44_13855 [Pseudomonadota bacterium]